MTDVPPLTDTDVEAAPPVEPAPDAVEAAPPADEPGPDAAAEPAPDAETTADGDQAPPAADPDAGAPAADVEPPAPAESAAAPAESAVTADGQTVERARIEGTQIDSADGVRKPVDQIDTPATPDFGALPTSNPSVSVLRETVTTQIGPDGKRYPINPGESAPAARHEG